MLTSSTAKARCSESPLYRRPSAKAAKDSPSTTPRPHVLLAPGGDVHAVVLLSLFVRQMEYRSIPYVPGHTGIPE
eukprot:scaffold214_cov249-Pinguiococcus_pyrenoidosus.AAC.8